MTKGTVIKLPTKTLEEKAKAIMMPVYDDVAKKVGETKVEDIKPEVFQHAKTKVKSELRKLADKEIDPKVKSRIGIWGNNFNKDIDGFAKDLLGAKAAQETLKRRSKAIEQGPLRNK